MSERTFIKELSANQLVEGVFAVQNCQLGQTRAGKPFLKCLLADKTGRVPGRMWNISEEFFRTLPTNGFAQVQGQSQPYQGEVQIIIQQIKPVQPSPHELKDLMPCTQYDVNEMFREVAALMESLSHPGLKALAQAYLDDALLMEMFRQAPAAMTLHHAYLGGLLEHTLSLLKLAEVILPRYPQLNRDIMLMGLFLHDLGKCAELTWEEGFGYSDDGLLVGHIARGLTWLQEKIKAVESAGTPLSSPLVRVLEHIILSHHGQPEFGALKIPATPEAIAIHMLDNVDAKLQMALAATRGDQAGGGEDLGGSFTEKIWALDTRLYRPDPTTLDDHAV